MRKRNWGIIEEIKNYEKDSTSPFHPIIPGCKWHTLENPIFSIWLPA
jgi:hypothetical protein